jgi:agmatine/peptidylarginine deiminase
LRDDGDEDYRAFEHAADLLAGADLKVHRVDADYVCWYVANESMVVGTQSCRKYDEAVLLALQGICDRYLGGRRVLAVDARNLSKEGGGVHCVTQQEPDHRWITET